MKGHEGQRRHTKALEEPQEGIAKRDDEPRMDTNEHQ